MIFKIKNPVTNSKSKSFLEDKKGGEKNSSKEKNV